MNSQKEKTKAEPSGRKDIEVISHEDDLWKVRIIFPSLEASDNEMVERLREAKSLISKEHEITPQFLELCEVLAKTKHPRGIAVDVSIGRTDLERGDPVIRLKPLTDDQGTPYPNMIAELDLFCLDENGDVITEDKIKASLEEQEVDLERCDLKTVQEAAKKCAEQGSPIKNIIVAKGKLPDIGTDAELEFSFSTDRQEAGDIAGYNRSRKVRKRDVICQKTPARQGENPGWNVMGEELPPVNGYDFELLAGDGADVARSGNILSATISGIAFVTISERNIKTPLGTKSFPETVEVTVKPVIQLPASDVDDDFVVEASVEVEGNLKLGQAIFTRGEIFVSGDVETGVTLRAGGDIAITGDINGGDITSDNSVFSSGEVKSTSITATNNIELSGRIDNCEISGSKVQIQNSRASRIIAGHKVTIKQISDTDEKTTIKVGRKDLYEQKTQAASKTIQGLIPSLMKIKKIFGQEKIVELRPSTIQQVLMKHLKQLRLSKTKLEEDNVNHLRRLLEAVDPLSAILTEKREEINYLQGKASEESSRKPIVVLRDKVDKPIDIKINDKHYQQGSTPQGVAIAMLPHGEIKSYDLRPPGRESSGLEDTELEVPETDTEG